MTKLIRMITSNELSLVMTVLPLSILAHNLFGAAEAEVNENKFDKSKFKKGLLKGLLVYVGIIIYTFISYLLSDLQIELSGEMYSLVDAMYIIILATIVRYSKEGIGKLINILNYKIKEDEVKNE